MSSPCSTTDGLTLDLALLPAPAGFWDAADAKLAPALAAMRQLEAGAIANPDEQRMVGHYWLRAAQLAPTPALAKEIESTRAAVAEFARRVHACEIRPPGAERFTDVLLIGIGGSALGPQLVADALGSAADRMKVHFMDNTDPDGIRRVLGQTPLRSTLALVVSKSGGTPETRNGMLEAAAVFRAAGLDFAKQAVAITGAGSNLDRHAEKEGWLARFPMWDWVGGRTSVMSAVGLLPMALQGLEVDEFLAGAAEMDAATRAARWQDNPAAAMAMAWHLAGNGRGEKDMVVLPYKDRLLLLSRYLQQLIMESLGKRHDLAGREVFQGLAVYGNKGSTDQHAYVQQLRDGVPNFFALFIRVLQDDALRPAPLPHAPLEVEAGMSSGDFLQGFLLGTRTALAESGRASLTITIDRLDARRLGALIALFERAVGFYATLVGVNAYHQPGVEAGKKAAASALDTLAKALAHLQKHAPAAVSAAQVASDLGLRPDWVASLLEYRAANGRQVVRTREGYAWRG